MPFTGAHPRPRKQRVSLTCASKRLSMRASHSSNTTYCGRRARIADDEAKE